MPPARPSFPGGFLWGAATSAHQTEGNNTCSDWWARENAPHPDVPQRSGDAADSWHRYADEMTLLSDLGLGAYRFSVEWARIEPEPGHPSRAALQHYRRMIDACLNLGLRPVVTLHHFTNPLWFARRGGWSDPGAPDLFARYAELVAPILDDVGWVCTINEPNLLAGAPDDPHTGAALPSLTAPDPAATAHIIEAHRRARDVLGGLQPGAQTGWSIAAQAYHAMPGCEDAMIAYRRPREDVFLEAAQGDGFIGVQAYLRTFIDEHGPVPVPDGVEKTLMGWEYFPRALEIAVRHAWYVGGRTPLLVTENGIATDDDTRRIDYTHEALRGLHAAMSDGVDVRGYLHWSAIDNYEWGSFRPTFGLISWDPETFARTPKPSARWLGDVARTGILHRP